MPERTREEDGFFFVTDALYHGRITERTAAGRAPVKGETENGE